MLKLVVLLLAGAIGFACSWDYLIWIPRSATADALYRFVVKGKAGYIDRQGKVMIEPRLEYFGNYANEFHDGLLGDPSTDGRYLDSMGNVVISRGLSNGWDFSEGLAVARKANTDLWGYVDRKGEFVITPRLGVNLSSFSEGLARVELGGKIGYIGRDGRFVIEPKFAHGTDFKGGMARVVVEGPCVRFTEGSCSSPVIIGKSNGADLPACRYEYIDKTGRVVTNGQFDTGRDFSEGLAPVRSGGVWGFIDNSGVLVIEPQFDDAWPISEGLARIVKNGGYGFINRSGQFVIESQLHFADDFHEGLAMVAEAEGRFRFIDRSGKQAIGREYELASSFFKGLAHVKLAKKKFAYIDTTGKVVFQY